MDRGCALHVPVSVIRCPVLTGARRGAALAVRALRGRLSDHVRFEERRLFEILERASLKNSS
jgi:hypothetical protein